MKKTGRANPTLVKTLTKQKSREQPIRTREVSIHVEKQWSTSSANSPEEKGKFLIPERRNRANFKIKQLNDSAA